MQQSNLQGILHYSPRDWLEQLRKGRVVVGLGLLVAPYKENSKKNHMMGRMPEDRIQDMWLLQKRKRSLLCTIWVVRRIQPSSLKLFSTAQSSYCFNLSLVTLVH